METFIKDFLSKNASGGQHGVGHYVYWVPIKVFHQLPVVRWKHNRPEDPDRVREIHDSTAVNKRMDGILYLACVNHQLVCYESNHRREALKGLEDVADILVDVLWGATDEDVKREFFRLNKAVSVPELYITDEPVVVDAEKLREVVDAFCRNYASHKVSSSRPQRPNFTRDMVFDEFYRAMKELSIDVDELSVRLQRLNQSMAQRDRGRLSEKTIAKCEGSGLWLFAWSPVLNLVDLQ